MTRRTKVLTVIYTALGVSMAIISYFGISYGSQSHRLAEIAEQEACRSQGMADPIWLKVSKRDALPRGLLSEEEKDQGNGSDQFDIFFCTDSQGRLQHISPPKCNTTHYNHRCE
ncbi:MAG: hypothetical protein WC551_06410 [Patescibacteria group bacterium]